MENLLQKNLLPDETLLWSARPETFEILDATYKKPIVRKISIILLSILVLSVCYILAAVNNGVKIQPIAMLICAAPFLYSIWNDFSDAGKLKNQIVYGLTDRRLLTLNGKQLFAMEYSKLNGYALLTDSEGHVSLVCGPDALKAKEKSRREQAVCGFRMNLDSDTCDSYAMYGITEHAQQIKQILETYAGA